MATVLKRRVGLRLVAALMVGGGIAGVVGSLRLLAYLVVQEQPVRFAVQIVAVLLFGWTTFVGWRVWQGRNDFLRWAKILFAMQVLVVGVGGYAYEFATGLSARVSVGGWTVPMPPPSHQLLLGANAGSSLNLNLTRESSRWTIGVNVVALIVSIYLFRTSRTGENPRVDCRTVMA